MYVNSHQICGMIINYKIIKAGSAELQLKGSYTEEQAQSCSVHFPGKPPGSKASPALMCRLSLTRRGLTSLLFSLMIEQKG